MPPIDQTGGVSAVARRRDILDVFVFGQNGELFTTWWVESTGWATGALAINGAVPANAMSGAAAVARDPDSLDIVFVGSDSRLYAVPWAASTWGVPVAIGGSGAPPASVVAGPAIVSRQPDILDVFWIGQDARLYTTWWTTQGGWSPGFIQLGSSTLVLSTVATPAVVARQADIIDVFVADTNGQVNTIWWTGGGGWAPAFSALDV
jgi:hypothetical protein